MSNHTKKITKTSFEVNGKLYFLKFGMVELLKTLHTFSSVIKNIS